jgi:hypothetical protein
MPLLRGGVTLSVPTPVSEPVPGPPVANQTPTPQAQTRRATSSLRITLLAWIATAACLEFYAPGTLCGLLPRNSIDEVVIPCVVENTRLTGSGEWPIGVLSSTARTSAVVENATPR